MPSSHEEWRPVVGYEGLYEVSNLGRVRRLRRTQPKILAQSSSGRHAGYLTVELWANGKRRQRFVHVAVINAFQGPPPSPDHRCAHDDGDNHNNTNGNLFWKTMKENMDDRERHGRTAKGERHGKAKMTDTQALAVKGLLPYHPNRRIAELVGVSEKSVQEIRANRTWKHL